MVGHRWSRPFTPLSLRSTSASPATYEEGETCDES